MTQILHVRRLLVGIGAAVLVGGLLSGCSLLGLSPNETVRTTLSVSDLVGEWAEWTDEGPTGLLYTFQADGTVIVSDLVVGADVVEGSFEVAPGGKAITVEFTEPTLGLSLGESTWTVLSVTREEIRFALPDGREITLKRLR
jgi:hypothetical protein